MSDKIEQAIRKTDWLQRAFVELHQPLSVRVCDEIKALLADLQREQACPVCKGAKTVDDGEVCESHSLPCPACSNHGDYRSWAENEIKRLDVRAKGLWDVIRRHETSLAERQ